MPTPVLRRAFIPLVSVCLVIAVAPVSPTTADDATSRLRLDFDDLPAGSILTDGAVITDQSGQGNNGVVVTSNGGSIAAVADTAGVVVDFPANCETQPCFTALVEIPDSTSLDPLTADFQRGARILMQPDQTADGENVVQKGLNDESGGQWKLQVDKLGGFPSCVVSGRVEGEQADTRVLVRSSVTVADGAWHQVTCRRSAADGVQVFVDAVVTGLAAMPAVNLDSNAAVTVGANRATPSPNDQFHGMLDDVFVTIDASVAQLPPGYIETFAQPAAANRPALRLGVVSKP
jgi:Concanavalin A-like lectin/glucanases superfamily